MIRNYADHSANERTFLAWIRTAVAIVGFGLAASRLGATPASTTSELAMLVAGALVVLIAYLRMHALRARIERAEELDSGSLVADRLLVALVIALLVLLASFAMHIRV